MIQLILGDSMQIMEGLQRKFDMIFLDPPFTEWLATDSSHYNVNHLTYYTKALLKPNGVVWLWGYVPQLINDWHYWKRWFRCLFDMVRIKTYHAPPPISPQYPIRAHENIWCLCFKKARTCDLKLHVRTKRPVKKTKVQVHDMREEGKNKVFSQYGMPTYVKSYSTYASIGASSKEYWGHPTQKPLLLVRKLISISTDVGDWILDPFAGAGSTLVEAQYLRRNCLGIEIERKYVAVMKKRLKQKKELKKLVQWLKPLNASKGG